MQAEHYIRNKYIFKKSLSPQTIALWPPEVLMRKVFADSLYVTNCLCLAVPKTWQFDCVLVWWYVRISLGLSCSEFIELPGCSILGVSRCSSGNLFFLSFPSATLMVPPSIYLLESYSRIQFFIFLQSRLNISFPILPFSSSSHC